MPIPSGEYLASKGGQTFLLKKIETNMFARKATVGRLLGLDALDWSMLLVGLALACALVALI